MTSSAEHCTYQVLYLYEPHSDSDVLEQDVRSRQEPIIRRLPGLRQWSINWCDDGADGHSPPYQLIVALEWDREDQALTALEGPVGQELATAAVSGAGPSPIVLHSRGEAKLPRQAEAIPASEYSLFGLYNHPGDPDQFDRHYRDVHSEIGLQLPGITFFAMRWGVDAPDGTVAAYHFVSELTWESREDLLTSLGSPAGEAAVADLGNFAAAGMEMILCRTAPKVAPFGT